MNETTAKFEKGDLVKYERPTGGSAVGYWMDESKDEEDPRTKLLTHYVKVRPAAVEGARGVWVEIDLVWEL